MVSRVVKHNCPNCGGLLDIELDTRIMRCAFCGCTVELERHPEVQPEQLGIMSGDLTFEPAASAVLEPSAQGSASSNGPWNVGRGDSCDITIKDSSMSRTHAKIQRLPNGTYTIEDLASDNGVSVETRSGGLGSLFGNKKKNFKKIDGRAVVTSSDRIRIGNYETTVGDLLSALK